MSTRTTFLALFAGLLWLSGCGTLRQTSSTSKETDDAYFSSADAEKERQEREAAKELVLREAGRNVQVTEDAPVVTADRYEDARESKYGNDEGHRYDDDLDPYYDDDFHYSRRVRRFTTRSWGYYDPFFSYDPYYVMGTPTWSYYANDPWFYDPFYYNGPSYSWTYGWGYPSWYFLPYQSYWYNPWQQPFGYSSWGFGSGFNGGGWYPGGYGGYGYGGYGGYYGYNPYCPPGLFYGNNNGGWNGGGNSGVSTHVGPRSSVSSLNANDRPGNTPDLAGGLVRPYQDPNEVSVRPVVTNVVTKPKPEGIISRPIESGAVKPTTQGRPETVSPNNSWERPDPRNNPAVTPKPDQQVRPKENVIERPVDNRPKQNIDRPNNSGGGFENSRPKENNISQPNYSPASSTPSYNRPSNNFSSPSPSPSRPSGGSFSPSPSSGGGKAVKR